MAFARTTGQDLDNNDKPMHISMTSATESGKDHLTISMHQLITRDGTKVRSSDAAPGAETHYVLLIHGTFAKPEYHGKCNWFYPDPDKSHTDNFANHLGDLLAVGEMGSESVWRTLPDEKELPSRAEYPFYWDGTNTDQGRKEGARHLAQLIRHIANRDPSARVHLICHSHGGNVAIKAIEQYVKGLESRSAEDEWPEEVRELFLDAHEAAANDIARWRRVEDVPWWAWMHPFLVVRRGAKGESGASESYWWGYHRAVDAALRLGTKRKNRFLANRRMTSPVSNALGKVILLGTPFYYKQWARHAAAKIALSLLLSFVGAFFLVWLGIGIRNQITRRQTLSEKDQRVVVYVALGLGTVLFVTHLATFLGRTLFRSGNMYHSDKVPWSPAQSALVIKAGKLDEVALALCAEPAARAFLLPMVKQATAHVGFVGFPRRPRPGARAGMWALYCLEIVNALILNVVLLIPRVIVWLGSKVVVSSAFGMIRDVIVAFSFGLDAADLKNARVYVEETLILGGGPRNIATWDVRKLLARAELRAESRAFSEGGDVGPGNVEPTGEVGGANRGGFGSMELIEEVREENGDGVLEAKTEIGKGTCVGDSVNALLTQRRSGRNMAEADSAGSRYQREVSAAVAKSAYSFLWDDDELRARSDASVMYNRLRSQMPKIDHSPRLSAMEFAREVRSICCVFEARFLEVRAHLQLAHATYYRNPVIVSAMVRFLNTGEVPPEAKAHE